MSKGVPKGFKWPSKAERIEREAKVYELRQQGLTFAEIAEAVGVSLPRASSIYAQALAKKNSSA